MTKHVPKLVSTDKKTFELFIDELHENPELTACDTYDVASPSGNVIASADVLNNKYYVWNGEFVEVDEDKQREAVKELVSEIVESLKGVGWVK